MKYKIFIPSLNIFILLVIHLVVILLEVNNCLVRNVQCTHYILSINILLVDIIYIRLYNSAFVSIVAIVGPKLVTNNSV